MLEKDATDELEHAGEFISAALRGMESPETVVQAMTLTDLSYLTPRL